MKLLKCYRTNIIKPPHPRTTLFRKHHRICCKFTQFPFKFFMFLGPVTAVTAPLTLQDFLHGALSIHSPFLIPKLQLMPSCSNFFNNAVLGKPEFTSLILKRIIHANRKWSVEQSEVCKLSLSRNQIDDVKSRSSFLMAPSLLGLTSR